jgi:hypothetical protein
MDPEGSARDDLNVRLVWPDVGSVGAVDEPDLDDNSPRRVAGSVEGTGLAGGPVRADLEPLASAIESMQRALRDLIGATASMRKLVEATASRIDNLDDRHRQGSGADVSGQLGELAKQVELLRRRVSLRARSEQLATETAERIAAAVIETLNEATPEAGPRSRRRSTRS